jgi:hypothetical protein
MMNKKVNNKLIYLICGSEEPSWPSTKCDYQPTIVITLGLSFVI